MLILGFSPEELDILIDNADTILEGLPHSSILPVSASAAKHNTQQQLIAQLQQQQQQQQQQTQQEQGAHGTVEEGGVFQGRVVYLLGMFVGCVIR